MAIHNTHDFGLQCPRLAVSACLAGQKVRFDGGHKQDHFVTQVAPQFFEIVTFCPEVELGMGAPRPTIQLQRLDGRVRLVDSRNQERDHTQAMQQFARERLGTLPPVHGFIVKKNSPSCGMERVPVINPSGMRERDGVGLFTQEILNQYPQVPVEEEGRLQDPLLRENFLERVFACHRWSQGAGISNRVGPLVEFHSRHKLMLMARGPHWYAELGRMVAGTTTVTLGLQKEAYFERFMRIMALRSSPGGNVNVLMHILGYFKRVLPTADKQELLEIFAAYRERRVPLISALLMLRHHLRHFPHPWLDAQFFLFPYPEALAPRNHY